MLQLVWLVCAVWAGSAPSDIPNPRASNGWVSDVAGVIDSDTQARMNARIEALHLRSGVEIAVVTVKDVQGTPKSFTTQLFNLWGVGDKDTNRGLLIVQVIDQRRLEMETGYGLEAQLPDGWLGTMQAKVMVPHFKRGDHATGLEAGLLAVEQRLNEGGPPAPVSSEPSSKFGESILDLMLNALAVAILIVLARLIFVVVRWWRDRRCPFCRGVMVCLSEAEDDAHLSAGERTEESLKSVNWLVYVCEPCDFTRVTPRRALFSSWHKCPQCSHRTSSKNTTTLVSATTLSRGRIRVHYRCMNCDYDAAVIKSTPRLTSSSGGGSSGGGGSFGGGSSGGGGAGSSW